MSMGALSKESWLRLGVAAVAVILLLVFVLQNSESVEVRFVVATLQTRLIWALLLAAGLGFLIGLVLPRFRNRA